MPDEANLVPVACIDAAAVTDGVGDAEAPPADRVLDALIRISSVAASGPLEAAPQPATAATLTGAVSAPAGSVVVDTPACSAAAAVVSNNVVTVVVSDGASGLRLVAGDGSHVCGPGSGGGIDTAPAGVAVCGNGTGTRRLSPVEATLPPGAGDAGRDEPCDVATYAMVPVRSLPADAGSDPRVDAIAVQPVPSEFQAQAASPPRGTDDCGGGALSGALGSAPPLKRTRKCRDISVGASAELQELDDGSNNDSPAAAGLSGGTHRLPLLSTEPRRVNAHVVSRGASAPDGNEGGRGDDQHGSESECAEDRVTGRRAPPRSAPTVTYAAMPTRRMPPRATSQHLTQSYQLTGECNFMLPRYIVLCKSRRNVGCAGLRGAAFSAHLGAPSKFNCAHHSRSTCCRS